MFANMQMMGMGMGFPDVCLTPAGPAAVPVPYPNIAMGPTAIPDQVIVMSIAMPVHNLGTLIPLTNGRCVHRCCIRHGHGAVETPDSPCCFPGCRRP